jgi:hypothetical protein
VADTYFAGFRRLSMLLLVIERVAALPRVRALTFYNGADTLVGQVSIEAGLVGSGAQVNGSVYIDEAFAREAAPVAPLMRKLLLGESLSVPEQLRLHNIPLIARRALCGVTARALRFIAQHCDLAKMRLVEGDEPPSRTSEERFCYSVVELLLAAGRVDAMDYDDAAARIYETPPGSPDERWLLEWQPDVASGPWPLMTTRIGERKTTTVAQLGILAQSLSRPLSRARREGRSAEPRAALGTTDLHAYYTVVTDRYVALLVYPISQLDKLVKSLEDFAFSAARSLAKSPIPPPASIPKYTPPHNRNKAISLPPAFPRPAPNPHMPAAGSAPGRTGNLPGPPSAPVHSQSLAAPLPGPAMVAPAKVVGSAPAAAEPPPVPIAGVADAEVPPATTILASRPMLDTPARAEDASQWLTAAGRVAPTEPSDGSQATELRLASDGDDAPVCAARAAVPPGLAPSQSAPDAGRGALATLLPPVPNLSLVAPAAPAYLPTADEEPAAPESPATPAPPVLELVDFTVSVHGQMIIHPVSLQVAPRGLHVWVLDGGVQQRLLLRVLCNGPTSSLTVSGQARFDGHELSASAPSTPYLPPRDARALMQSAREYLLDGLPASKGPRPSSRLPSLLQRVEHAGFADLVPHLDLRQCELEPFERRVIEVLRGVSSGARLLVQDDPLRGLEPEQADRLLQLLRAEAERRAILVLAGSPQLYLDPRQAGRLQISWLEVASQPVILPGQTGAFEAVKPVEASLLPRRSQASG